MRSAFIDAKYTSWAYEMRHWRRHSYSRRPNFICGAAVAVSGRSMPAFASSEEQTAGNTYV
jgi:hypothetical protein